MRESNLATCVKHWPGDGTEERDQHLVLGVNELSVEEWEASFGKVYRGLIDDGLHSIMAGHIALPEYPSGGETLTGAQPRVRIAPESGSLSRGCTQLRAGTQFHRPSPDLLGSDPMTAKTATTRAKSGKSASQGWVPRQHGAWAMLIVPFALGVVLRARVADLDAWLVPLAATVFAAYFCFNALTFWLRAAPARRSSYTRPVLVYGAIALVFGVLALVMGGWPITSWLPIGLPFAVLAVWLASHRNDRAVLSGFATEALAVGMGLVVRFITPAAMVDEWSTAYGDVAIMVALFVYFFGTVLHVKALIRERGRRPARVRAVTWHAVATLVAVAAALAGWASPLWVAFFTVTTLRTWYMSRPDLVGRFKPAQIGVLEIVLSVSAFVIGLF